MNAIPTTPADVGVDDGDLLHAVMAFLNDNDAVPIDVDDATTTDAYSSSHSDHTASPTHSAKEEPSGVLPRLQPRRPKINRSRQRMRQETIALREHVLELQDRLEVLQGGVSSKVGIPPAKKLVQERESRDARHLRALAWQAIAEHESVKKQAAEEERERLRALLKEQKLAFRRLRRYLSKYGANSQWAPLKNDLFTDGKTPDDEVKPELKTDHDGFDDITRTLPAMYLQTNAVFADTRLDHLTSSLRDIKIQNPLTPTMSVEALDSRLVPFDLAQTARAVWEFHRTKVRELSTSEDKRLEESDECIRREFSSAIEHQQICGMSRVRMETRRYVEQERVVFVQSAIYDNLVVDNTLVPNYGLRQFQWTVICPPRHYLMRQSGKPMSQVEVYEVTVPILDHVTGIERTDLLVRMKKLCEVTADVHRELERESVETILMDSLLKSTNLDSAMFQPPSIAAL